MYSLREKRELLQVLMSIRHPWFFSCYITGLKILLEEIWRYGIQWDDELSDPLCLKWHQRKTTIALISLIEIQRCYTPHLTSALDIHLNTFVNDGEDAYVAVYYLRVQYCYQYAVIAGKSKITSLNPVFIPKLELEAAVISVRLLKVRCLTINFKIF